MSEDATIAPPEIDRSTVPGSRSSARSRPRAIVHALRFGNIGAVYVWIGIIIFFTIERPGSFLTWETAKVVLNLNAITGLVALSLVVPLCARIFDLSVGYIVALTSVVSAALIVQHHYALGLAVVVCIVISLAAGVTNVILVVVIKIDSFIATLATGALYSATVILVSSDIDVTNTHLINDFSFANTSVAGLNITVYILAVVAVVLWWLLEHTVTGRRLYATGFNEEAARLAGVRTHRLQAISLMVSAFVAGVAGVLVTSSIGSGSPDIGPSYLLSSFAAVFLGSTQFRNGRFNAQGTVVAVLMLATGAAGLSLMGAPLWASDMFTGVVLVASLAFYRLEQARVRSGARRRRPGAGPGTEGRDEVQERPR